MNFKAPLSILAVFLFSTVCFAQSNTRDPLTSESESRYFAKETIEGFDLGVRIGRYLTQSGLKTNLTGSVVRRNTQPDYFPHSLRGDLWGHYMWAWHHFKSPDAATVYLQLEVALFFSGLEETRIERKLTNRDVNRIKREVERQFPRAIAQARGQEEGPALGELPKFDSPAIKTGTQDALKAVNKDAYLLERSVPTLYTWSQAMAWIESLDESKPVSVYLEEKMRETVGKTFRAVHHGNMLAVQSTPAGQEIHPMIRKANDALVTGGLAASKKIWRELHAQIFRDESLPQIEALIEEMRSSKATMTLPASTQNVFLEVLQQEKEEVTRWFL